MPTFSAGAITNPNPMLLDYPAIDRAATAQTTNALLQDQTRQNMADADTERVARLSQYILTESGGDPAKMAALYSQVVPEEQRQGRLRNAPAQFVGAETIRRLASAGISSEKQGQQRINLAGNNALLQSLNPPTPGPSATTPGPNAGTYEGSVIQTEGTGRNPRSSATGTGQFIDSTWRAFAAANPQLFTGKTPEQVMAARSDPALGQAAVTWLAQQNATQMSASGVEPTGTSLRVAHWVGAGPAAKIMQAPDDAPVRNFISPEAVAANPELATMTAGQMRTRFANVPTPSFLTPPGGGRTQEASVKPTQMEDGSPTPPAPGVQQPAQQQPGQQQTATTTPQQPQQQTITDPAVPPPGRRFTPTQEADLLARKQTATPEQLADQMRHYDTENRIATENAKTRQRQAAADARQAEQDRIAAEKRQQDQQDRLAKIDADRVVAERAGREEDAKRLAAQGVELQRKFDNADKLRDEATKITETFRPMQEAYERIGEAAKAGNALGDLGLIYTYTRLLDPATVHEEEIKRGMKAGGLGEYVSGWLARVTKGESLTPAVRQQFVEMARRFYDVRKKGYDQELGRYRTLAEKFGLDPDTVAVSLARDQEPPPLPAGFTVVQ
jgi:hypothetical protein